MIIPWKQLSAEALDNIIREFILREGTDYGEQEVSLEAKINEVKLQLERNLAVIVYSELHETVNIMPADQFNAETN